MRRSSGRPADQVAGAGRPPIRAGHDQEQRPPVRGVGAPAEVQIASGCAAPGGDRAARRMRRHGQRHAAAPARLARAALHQRRRAPPRRGWRRPGAPATSARNSSATAPNQSGMMRAVGQRRAGASAARPPVRASGPGCRPRSSMRPRSPSITCTSCAASSAAHVSSTSAVASGNVMAHASRCPRPATRWCRRVSSGRAPRRARRPSQRWTT